MRDLLIPRVVRTRCVVVGACLLVQLSVRAVFAQHADEPPVHAILPQSHSLPAPASGFATGITHRNLQLRQYVTLDTSGYEYVINTGEAPIRIDSVVPFGADLNTFVFSAGLRAPTVIAPLGMDSFQVVFKPNPYPNQPISSGRRQYVAGWAVYNNTDVIDTVSFVGSGQMVDVHARILTTYRAFAGDVMSTDVEIDSCVDTLGLADARGFTLTARHYRRTVIRPWILPVVPADVDNRQTNTAGSMVRINTIETTTSDSAHNVLEQGFLEFNADSGRSNVFVRGTLLRLRWYALYKDYVDSDGNPRLHYDEDIAGVYGSAPGQSGFDWNDHDDTSAIVIALSHPTDVAARPLSYYNFSATPGLVAVPHFLRVYDPEIYPNASASPGAVHIAIKDTGRVTMDLYDILGRRLRRLMDNQLLVPGDYSVRMEPPVLVPGTYFVNFSGGGFYSARKFEKLAQ